MNNSTKNAVKSTVNNLKVVNKAEQKLLSVPTPKVKAPKIVKVKAPKIELHKALLDCNQLDKAENFSLSGALNRLKKQVQKNQTYKGITPVILDEAMKFDNLLKNVSARCIASQRFTVYALGLAVNKYLKTALK
jgi:hypothetical protein